MLKLSESRLGRVFAGSFAVVALAYMLGFAVAPSQAYAQESDDDMQERIEELEALIELLQAQLEGTGTTVVDANTCPVDPNLIVTVPLKQGVTNNDVRQVQVLMNYFADEMGLPTRVAVSGAGSAGMETMTFGPATHAAVVRFQEHFRAQILTPNGLLAGTGIVGPSTMAQIQLLCSEIAAGEDDDDGAEDEDDTDEDDSDEDDSDDEDDEDEDDDNDLDGGEASLENFDVNGSDNSVEEGEEDEEVLSFEFDVEDGDVMVERVDVAFEALMDEDSSGDDAEDDPSEFFDSVRLYVMDDSSDSDEDEDDEDDEDEDEDEDDNNDMDGWREVGETEDFEETDENRVGEDGSTDDDEEGESDAYEVRFTDLDDVMFNEGETAEFMVVVDVADGIDDEDLEQEFAVYIPEDGVRAVDGEGLDQYTGSDDDSVDEDDYATVSFDEEGTGEDLELSESEENPDSSILMVEEDEDSEEYGILVFNLEGEDGDFEVSDITVELRLGDSTGTSTDVDFDEVVANAYLEVDGEEYDYDGDEEELSTASSSSSEGQTFALDFDLDDLMIEEGDEMEFTFVVEFNEQGEDEENYENGFEVQASVDGDDIDAEGDDDAEVDGSVQGEEHTLVAEGIYAEAVSTSADSSDNNTSAAGGEEGDFEITFDVTAFEGDFFIPQTSDDMDTASGTIPVGFVYSVERSNSSGTTTTTTTSQSAVDSDADEEEIDGVDFFVVREGETEEFTLSVTVDGGGDGFFRVQLEEINFTEEDDNLTGSDFEDYEPTPEEDFRTDFEDLDF